MTDSDSISEENILLGNAIVSEDFAAELLTRGSELRIACLKDAELRSGAIAGLWTVEVCYHDKNSKFWLPITKTVGGRKPYKTATSLIVLLMSFGIEGIKVPFKRGLTFVQRDLEHDA